MYIAAVFPIAIILIDNLLWYNDLIVDEKWSFLIIHFVYSITLIREDPVRSANNI